jgi:hypothetical protein
VKSSHKERFMRLPVLLGAAALFSLTGCFGALITPMPSYSPPSAADQNEAFAKSMGYPAQHSAEELEAFLDKNLEGYQKEGKVMEATLDAPPRVPLELKRGKCYFMVLRLGEGAKYSDKGRAGLRFDYEPQGAGSQISGGPGIHGPGGAGSAGCVQQNGSYEFLLRAIVGASDADLGTGPITLQLYSKPISEKQLANLKADQDRQIAESQKFKAEQDAKDAERARMGCSTCDARYQGCRGAGRTPSSCQSDYRSCAFQEVGASWMSKCQMPMN